MAALGIPSALAIELRVIPAWRFVLPAPRDPRDLAGAPARRSRPALQGVAGVVGWSPRIVLALPRALRIAAVGLLELQVNTSFRS